MGRFFAAMVFVLAALPAQGCLFARDTQPAYWFEWASVLFAAEVTAVEHESARALDILTVRVVETFKGPQGSVATLRVPSRMWASCKLELPAVGARVLVALNANSDTLLVPLSAAYAERLRELKQ